LFLLIYKIDLRAVWGNQQLDISFLKNLQQLETLDISHNGAVDDFNTPLHLPNLKGTK
jgi:hypothetical protein